MSRAYLFDDLFCRLLHRPGFLSHLRSFNGYDGPEILPSSTRPAVNTLQFDWACNHMPRRIQLVPPIHAPEAIVKAAERARREVARRLGISRDSVAKSTPVVSSPAA